MRFKSFLMVTMVMGGAILNTNCTNANNGNNDSTVPTTPAKNVVETYTGGNGYQAERSLISTIPAPDGANNEILILGDETIQLGGKFDKQTGGVMDNAAPVYTPRSLSVYGRPYGSYNKGCSLCVFSSSSGPTGGSGQAAISGVDYHGGASAVSGSDMANVGFYHYDENTDARLVSQAASFGPGMVTLAYPMTEKQMSQLHVGMYIATNVINPKDSVMDNQGLLRSPAYWGYIKSWDASHIYVYDWAVPGDGNGGGGQVPDITYLDKTLSTYTVPMLFVGVPKKVFGENEYMYAEGNRVLGNKATAVVNAYEREEFDFRGWNWTKPHSLSFHGWTTSFECNNCDSRALSDDSYAYLVNGLNGLPRAYVAQTVGDALEFSGYSTMIGGSGGPERIGPNGEVMPVTVGSNHIMASFASNLPGNNTMHMSTIITRNSLNYNDWRDFDARLVMDMDSTRDRQKGLMNGSRMGSIAFNYLDPIKGIMHPGGVCLLGYDSNEGLCEAGDGSVSFAKPVTVNSDLYVGAGHFLFFSTPTNRYGSYFYMTQNGDIGLGTQVSGGGNLKVDYGIQAQTMTLSGIARLGSMSRPEILALKNVDEGTIVNDRDDHVPVIYEQGHWYPMTLDKALN